MSIDKAVLEGSRGIKCVWLAERDKQYTFILTSIGFDPNRWSDCNRRKCGSSEIIVAIYMVFVDCHPRKKVKHKLHSPETQTT